MSHVDEGTLHAYLDGELSSEERTAVDSHLMTCATCRALLVEERALVQRASALLGSARPAERPVPPFEQVRRAPKRSPWRVSTPLAWAASIMLALGLGYYLRGGAAMQSNAPAALQYRAQPTPVAAATDTVTALGAMRADKVAESTRPSRKPRAPQAAADVAQEMNAAVVDSLLRRDSAAAGLVAIQPPVQLRGASPTARQREADSIAAVRRSAVALEEAVVTAAPAAAERSRENVIVDGAPALRRAEGRSVRNLVSTTWPLISRGKAASLLGDRPVGVPGLATRLIRQSPGADSTVMVEQTLDSNTVIQIFQRPATAAGNYDASRERAVLARYVGRLRVEITGPVSTDSLNKLLEQVEPIP